ncbi:hypothetical protein CR513_48278, partial [Mucuna pruriens]
MRDDPLFNPYRKTTSMILLYFLRKSNMKDKRSREKANSEIWNCENDNLSKKSHGKEKISDSKCSWSLLSDSSDRGTDRTFSYSHDYSVQF